MYPSRTFYGLSAEVKKHLLRDTRGISALYGRPCHPFPLEDMHDMCLQLEENISLFNKICADVACEGCYTACIYIVSAAQYCTGYVYKYIHYVQLVDPYNIG